MPDWELLDRTARPLTGRPSVGIQRGKGNLSLNQASYEALGRPEAVNIMFDRKERLIGLQAAALSVRNYKLNKQGSSNTYLIAGKALVQAMEIDTQKAMRYDAEMRDGILVIDLAQGEPVEVGQGRPKAKQPGQMALPA